MPPWRPSARRSLLRSHPHRTPGGALGLGLIPLAGLGAACFTLSAAPRFVMEIRDHAGDISIAGESEIVGHEGAIEVVSFGKRYRYSDGFPAYDTTHLECGIITDKALPKLLEAACAVTGVLPQVDLYYLGDPDRPLVNGSAHMRLEHVQIVGLDVVHTAPQAVGLAPSTAAFLSLNFSKVTWIYREMEEGAVVDQIGTTHVAFEATEDPNFDDDGDGLSNEVDLDDDGDGVPDAFERLHGTHALRDDANEDLDGDRQTNFQEWLANTGAGDRRSFFAIRSLSVEQTPAGKLTRLAVPLVPDRHYRVLGTTNPKLPWGEWSEYDAFDTPAEAVGSEVEVELDPSVLPQLERIFFAVEISPRR